MLLPNLNDNSDCFFQAFWAAVRFIGRNAEVAEVACHDPEATDRSHRQQALPGLTVKVCDQPWRPLK